MKSKQSDREGDFLDGTAKKPETPEFKVGDIVNYHAWLGSRVTSANHIIQEIRGGVAAISKKDKWIDLSHLSLVCTTEIDDPVAELGEQTDLVQITESPKIEERSIQEMTEELPAQEQVFEEKVEVQLTEAGQKLLGGNDPLRSLDLSRSDTDNFCICMIKLPREHYDALFEISNRECREPGGQAAFMLRPLLIPPPKRAMKKMGAAK